MTRLLGMFGRKTSNPGRDLAAIAVTQRREAAEATHQRILRVAREMRAADGMPPSPALQPDFKGA